MTGSRIANKFAESTRRKLLVPYITAGDPNLDITLALMHTLVRAGADIIELGVPFSDPMADGPVIQAACERALTGNVTLAQVIQTVERFRETDQTTAVVLMGYMNPVEALGYKQFAESCQHAGVDGVLTVDLPPEEAQDLVHELNDRNIDSIFLLSPTTPQSRMVKVCEQASGYIYYVSLKGVTGAANINVEEVAGKVQEIQSLSSLPVAVGFGIRDAESAALISKAADAIVVGSALVSLVGEHGENPDSLHEKLYSAVNAMRQAMDQVETVS